MSSTTLSPGRAVRRSSQPLRRPRYRRCARMAPRSGGESDESACRRRRRRIRSGRRWRRIGARRRRSGMGRRLSRGGEPSGNRNLVPFGIHALGITDVVALLYRTSRGVGSARASHGAEQQAGSRAHPCAATAAHGCSGHRANCGADRRTFHVAVDGRLLRTGTADALRRVIAALVVVRSELIEAHPGARQGHDAGTGGKRRAAGGHQHGGDERNMTSNVQVGALFIGSRRVPARAPKVARIP
jgi:hypothetical protein